MSEKITILAIHVHDNQGVEIEINTNKAEMPAVTLIGLLEQIKFDLLNNQKKENSENPRDLTEYEA
jgi:hypothetical protein